MRKKNVHLWEINSQGQLYFPTLERILKIRYKPESFWNHPIFLVAILIICTAIDIAIFRSLFDTFLLDKPSIRNLSIGAMVFAFDLVPIYLGINLRRRMQGYNVSRAIITLMVVCFLIAFGANVLLRLAFMDLALPDLTLTSTSIYGNVNLEATGSPRALPYAIFASILPLLTSLGCFLIAYTMSNPLKQEKERLEYENLDISNMIGQLLALLQEKETDQSFYKRLTRDDDAKYEAMKNMIWVKVEIYQSHVNERIKGHVGRADANSALSQPLKRIV